MTRSPRHPPAGRVTVPPPVFGLLCTMDIGTTRSAPMRRCWSSTRRRRLAAAPRQLGGPAALRDPESGDAVRRLADPDLRPLDEARFADRDPDVRGDHRHAGRRRHSHGGTRTRPGRMVVVETDGGYEQADSLKVAFDGAPSTGLSVFTHSLDSSSTTRASPRGSTEWPTSAPPASNARWSAPAAEACTHTGTSPAQGSITHRFTVPIFLSSSATLASDCRMSRGASTTRSLTTRWPNSRRAWAAPTRSPSSSRPSDRCAAAC